MTRNTLPRRKKTITEPKTVSEFSTTCLSKLTEMLYRKETKSIDPTPRSRKSVRNGAESEIGLPFLYSRFSRYAPHATIRMPAAPAMEGSSPRMKNEVRMRKTGVNASMGTESERSVEASAR